MKAQTNIPDEAIGWYGTIVILGAYALANLGFFGIKNPWYLFFNITGSLGIAYISFKKKTYQPAVLNLIWAMIGIVAAISSLMH